jgi:hypothetical protein
MPLKCPHCGKCFYPRDVVGESICPFCGKDINIDIAQIFANNDIW